MVSFQCDYCGDVVKKPKLDQHRNRCHSTFTCIDCSTTFQGIDYKSHTSCISEAEKYQKTLYKGKGKKNNNNGQSNNNNKKPEQQQKKDTPASKPLSLVEELKKKKDEETASSGEKRKQDEEEQSTKSNKKAKKENKWEETELPKDVSKALELALRETLRASKTPLSIKDARKKAIKLLISHPKSTNNDKKELKEKFDEGLVVSSADDVITVKTA
ncbi:hypothetical protein BDA99DRAFT_571186 [Phascolomyces articulosus]|uniref:Zinc finger C2H2 LYAR-type domain-containing protein n=1 Tax=Phascolomyces articulosus TaxID=60185 RepID=A0AAD5PFL3_9FUNG|nr:hypothetical protein BDA99DRAFT_571186 [Phascolomyces articulosus]